MSGSSDNTARVSEKREREREGGREREREGGRDREGGRERSLVYTVRALLHILFSYGILMPGNV